MVDITSPHPDIGVTVRTSQRNRVEAEALLAPGAPRLRWATQRPARLRGPIRSGKAYPIVAHGGRWMAWQDAVLHVDALGLRFALVVFDALRVYRRYDGTVQPFARRAHAARLRNSLALLKMADPGVGELEVVSELLERNEVRGDAYVRVSVADGNVAGLTDPPEPVLTAVVSHRDRNQPATAGGGLDVQISTWQRAPAAAFPPAAKCAASYAGASLALREARDAGFDQCLLVTADGFVCESPTANLFVVRDRVLLTPPLADCVLPGITRQWVLDTAPSLGLEAREQRLTPGDVRTSDEAFLCGTAIEISPVRSVDSGRLRRPADSVTARIADRFAAAVREPEHHVSHAIAKEEL